MSPTPPASFLSNSVHCLAVCPATDPTPPGVMEVCSLLTPQCPPPEARGQL